MSQGFVNPYTYATSAPTITKYTSGSGTYTTPAGVKFLVVEMVGGGGGGSAASTGTPTNGTSGGNTTFGSSLLTAYGGAAPVGGTGAVSGGLGGSFTINSPASGQGFNGGDGGAGAYLSGTTGDNAGGSGGSNPFGGSPTGGKSNTAGTAGYANTGAGGSGGGIGATGTATAGAGGGAGGYIYAVINNPSATYSYSVGAGGNGGTGYTNGGAGAAGIIIIYEYYEVLGIPTTLTLPLPIANGGTGTSVAPSTFYVNTANTSIGSIAIVKYSNVVNDSANAYSTSTGLYTIPTTGWYTVNANIKTTSYNYGVSAIIQIDIRQNSTVIAQQIITPTAYNSTSLSLNAGTVYKFTAGDTVSVYGFSNIGGGGGTTLDNSVTNFLSINFLHT